MSSLHEIIKQALEAEGYDGLFREGECACKLGNLMPCDEPSPRCEAGKLLPCDGSCESGECDFHIGPEEVS